MARTATIVRETSESKVELSLNLDGTGKTDIDTSVPFYNHMMTALGKHSLIDLTIKATGDTDIDAHHTVEDIAIVFGEALKQALGDKRGIRRFADATVPLDEALAKAVVDISAQCVGSEQGAVAILRNLDGDGPEAAARDITTVGAGMPVILAVNRADKLEATLYVEGESGQTFAPPVLFTSTASFVEDLMLGITDLDGLKDSGLTIVDSADLDRDDAMKVIAEHTRFGRGGAAIE